MVDKYNADVYDASAGNKFIIVAQDSVIGANSAELRPLNFAEKLRVRLDWGIVHHSSTYV